MAFCDSECKNKAQAENPNPKQNKKKTLVGSNTCSITVCFENHHKVWDFSLSEADTFLKKKKEETNLSARGLSFDC